MRLGLIPESLLDHLAFLSGKLPTPLLEATWGMALSKVIYLGTRLGVFDAIAQGLTTVEAIARQTGSNPAAMASLLNALSGFGYLDRRAGEYRLTKPAKKWLAEGSPDSLRDSILLIEFISGMLDATETSLRTGQHENFHDPGRTPEFWRLYLKSLASFARLAAPRIVRSVKLRKPPAKLLDIGGGHGLYSAAFCRRHPGLTATVIDLPPAAAVGREIVKKEGLADRIKFQAGDLRDSDWGIDYDLILLFNIIHNLGRSEVPMILKRCWSAVSAGGAIAILDSEHGGGGRISATAGFNELMFYVLNGTRVYPEPELRTWLRDAGFTGLRTKRFVFLPMMVLLTGRKNLSSTGS